MKVYFSKLPKDCYECPCFKNDLEFSCGLSDGTQDFFKDEIDGGKCPLISIKVHDRELVKEVCEKIRKHLSEQKKSLKDTFSPYSNGKAFIISSAEDILNDIQKEYEK